jgi:epoxyqueuosine reductase QueG
MCPVLTDAPLAIEATTQTTASRCGECNACIESCPAGALRGRDWDPHISSDAAQVRDALLDVEKCSCLLRCMLVCPWTLRYARLPQQ